MCVLGSELDAVVDKAGHESGSPAGILVGILVGNMTHGSGSPVDMALSESTVFEEEGLYPPRSPSCFNVDSILTFPYYRSSIKFTLPAT